jgi:hypothetical protein
MKCSARKPDFPLTIRTQQLQNMVVGRYHQANPFGELIKFDRLTSAVNKLNKRNTKLIQNTNLLSSSAYIFSFSLLLCLL